MKRSAFYALLILATGVVWSACGKEENPPLWPIENLRLPTDSLLNSDNPVTLYGKGFVESSEIWLMESTRFDSAGVILPPIDTLPFQTVVTEVDNTHLTFMSPKTIHGAYQLYLRQNLRSYFLGKLEFE